MRIELSVPDGAMAKLTKSIKRQIAKRVEDVGLKVYNTIVLGELTGVESPYFSGAYISSWEISKGIPRTKFNEPQNIRNVYARPGPKLDLGGVKFGQRVFISNASPHASIVEYEGTPTHPQPWLTATHARNQVVMTYKYTGSRT